MENYDVIVVGAGPAGSMAAKTLAEKGRSVLLVERKKEIGAPVRCGEGFGAHWEKALGIKIDEHAISCRINGAKLFSPDLEKSLTVKYDESKGYVLDRKVFDKQLAIDAARKGAEITVKSEVVDVVREGDRVTGVVIENDNGKQKVNAEVVIAADGAESRVARMAGLATTSTLYESDTGYEYELVNVDCEDLIELYFSNEYAKRGYLWVFPKGKDVANVGVGIGGHVQGCTAKECLDRWMKGPMKERFKHAQPVAIKGGLIPVGLYTGKIVGNGIVVIGTAAHLVDPIHGGGIALAMHSGVIAGNVVDEALESRDVSEKALHRFVEEWEKSQGKKLKKRLLLRKALEKLTDDDFNYVFRVLSDEDITLLLQGKYAPVVKKVLVGRPQLLKVLSALL